MAKAKEEEKKSKKRKKKEELEREEAEKEWSIFRIVIFVGLVLAILGTALWAALYYGEKTVTKAAMALGSEDKVQSQQVRLPNQDDITSVLSQTQKYVLKFSDGDFILSQLPIQKTLSDLQRLQAKDVGIEDIIQMVIRE